MRERDYKVKGEVLADGSGKKTTKYIRIKALGYDQFVRGCYRSLGKGFTKEEIAEAIKLQSRIRQATTIIKAKTAEDVVRRASANSYLIDTSSEKFKGAPGLTRWAETQNLKAAAHAFAVGGSVPELMDKIDALKREMDEINDRILACDKKLMNNKTLAVYVRNYEENRRFGLGYRRAKDQDQYYRINESRIMLFEAAERNSSYSIGWISSLSKLRISASGIPSHIGECVTMMNRESSLAQLAMSRRRVMIVMDINC